LTHDPDESHALLPVHVSGSVPFLICTQAPVPAAHAVHGPVHADTEQQYPSLHAPDAHSAFVAHVAPSALGTNEQ
jgi:hypothetical protein